MQKEGKLITIIIVIVILAIILLTGSYLIYTHYSDNEGRGGSTVVNETNTTQPPVNETPTITTNQTTTNTTNTSTTTTTGGGSNNGGGGGTTTPTCTDTCNSLGYECGNQSICGSEMNCGTCDFGNVCEEGRCIPSSCLNKIQDGDEEGIDCGGSCEFECPTNWKSGISVLFNGTPGVDYAEEYFYYDKLIDDHKVVYIKSDTPIIMEHNERNCYVPDTGFGVTIVVGGDNGTIRYRFDQELQWKYDWTGLENNPLPEYTGEFSLSEINYMSGIPIVGSIGDSGVALTKENAPSAAYYTKGSLDEFGDEWHVFAYADDDTNWANHDLDEGWKIQRGSSDGKTLLFVVNPKTPLIYFETLTNDSQFYTTPPKAYFLPKIHNQTTYLTDDVQIKLVNIMNPNPIYYQIDNGEWTEYSVPINSNQLSDGKHTLNYYYNNTHHKTRTIIKNPDYPSDEDVILGCVGENCSEHGYLLWKNDKELEKIRQNMFNSSKVYYEDYIQLKSHSAHSTIDENHKKGLRYLGSESTFTNAFISVIENNFTYAEYAKKTLLESKIDVDFLGAESYPNSFSSNPTFEKHYYGYYAANPWLSRAFSYDLLIKKFRPENGYENGITPIEDYKIRDSMAQYVELSLMSLGRMTQYNLGSSNNKNGMWDTATQITGAAIAIAMPSYETPYFGKSGFDSNEGGYKNTPYPDQKITWKQVFYDETNPLIGFPNQEFQIGIRDLVTNESITRPQDNQILPPGSFMDRTGYYSYPLMGHLFQIHSNIMKMKFQKSYQNLETSYKNANIKNLYGYKGSGNDLLPKTYSQLILINKYFPEIAGQAEQNILNESSTYFLGPSLNKETPEETLDYLMYQARPYSLIFYDDEWGRSYCNEIKSCSDYSSQELCDADYCNLKCNGDCEGELSSEQSSFFSKIWNWIINLFNKLP